MIKYINQNNKLVFAIFVVCVVVLKNKPKKIIHIEAYVCCLRG